MVDLHLHTYYSDGVHSPKELIRLASEKGISTVAITDHDGTGGIKEAVVAGKRYGIRVIPAIEFSTEDPCGAHMHLLGYNIDVNNSLLRESLIRIREVRDRRNQKIIETLAQMGYPISLEDLEEISGTDYIGKPNFARALVKKGYINDPLEAFAEGFLLRSDEVRKIKREKISVAEAIRVILDARGVPVLAHPLKISWIGSEQEYTLEQRIRKLGDLLNTLTAYGLKGMECYYSKHNLEETEQLIALAKARKLLISAGSDYHGPSFKPQAPGLEDCPEENLVQSLFGDGKL